MNQTPIDKIIYMLGDLSTSEIVGLMHEEKAYKKTPSNQIIPYTFSKYLKFCKYDKLKK